MFRKRIFTIRAVLALSGLLTGQAPATENTVDTVLPQVGQRGTTVQVWMKGAGLESAEEVLFYRAGIRCTKIEPRDEIPHVHHGTPVKAEAGTAITLTFEIADDAPLGEYLLSRSYQLSATTNESNEQDTQFFSHASLRRMRADTLFDALTQALDYKHKFRRSTADRALVMFEGGRRDNYNSYFFKTFGQSRRESVCACEDRTEANLSQALHLMNGRTIDEALTRNPQLIPGLMDQHDSHEAIIKALYVRALSREPSTEELEGILATIEDSTDKRVIQQAYGHVIWGLLNSSEFMFNH